MLTTPTTVQASVQLAALLLIAGAITVAIAHSFSVLLIGRALQGLGSGCTITATSVYITEIAPTRLRGTLVCVCMRACTM